MIFTGGNRGNRVLWKKYVVRFDEIPELVEVAVVWPPVLRYLCYLLSCPELCRRVQLFVSISVHSW
jgi:hypothetical protein